MLRIRHLIPRSIAAVAAAAIALALLPSPAAADNHRKEGDICGYSQDKYETDALGNVLEDEDGNPIPSDKKYLLKYQKKNPNGPNEDSNMRCAENTDGPGGTARALTGSTTSASTIASIYAGHGSRTGNALVNWCANTMFQYAARVPYDGTTNYDEPAENNYVDPSGMSTNEFTMRTGRQNMMDVYTTWKSDARVLDFDDLVAGERFCSSGLL